MLKCVSKYKSSLGSFLPGDVIDNLELELALLTDSPLSFAAQIQEQAEIKQAEIESDKMLRRGRVK